MNKQRGDVAVTIDGQDYVLRPTYQALAEIESRTGVGLVALAGKFMNRDFGVTEAVTIVSAGIAGSGEKPPKDLGDMMIGHGVLQLAGPILEFLTNGLTGDQAGKADGPPRE